MLQLRSSSLADTYAIAAGVAALARPGDIIVLAGEMGTIAGVLELPLG